ncbi:O-antigen ligase family protein [Aridibaculum aurantiacum]|uniref:O-antigen ligase family protein n=1 Tax=Aridibaculum aurantiacum TaxID=2810307 RepID=UPI001A96E4D0|nr:O-antigen ligase family protein [Aridibaculum aurantiacum]
MLQLSLHKKFMIAAAIFIAAMVVAFLKEQPLFLLLPFAYVVAKPVWYVVVNKTHWLFYLLIFLLPLSTEYNFTPSLGIDFPDEPLMMLLTAAAILLFFHSPKKFPAAVLQHPLFFLLIIHLLWIATCCFYSTNTWLSIKFLLAKTWFIVPFVILPSMINWSNRRLKLLAYLLLLPMLFVVVQSIARHALYGFSFEGIKYTLSPFFRNHVNYSAMLVCLLPLAFVMRSAAKQQHRIIWNLALTIAMAGVVFAYARGAWLALFFGGAAAVILYFKWLKHVLILALAALIAASAWLVKDNNYLRFAHDFNTTVFHEDIGEHLSATVQLKDVSNAERFYRWVAAANMVPDKPIVGFGPNTFYQNYKRYTITQFRTWVSENPEHSTVHNYFLLTLVEQGVPGLVIFLLLFYSMLLHCEKLYHRHRRQVYKNLSLAIGVSLTMIGSLLLSSDLLETDKIGSLFWLSLGFIIVLQSKLHKQPV